jgi:acyl carrier protein
MISTEEFLELFREEFEDTDVQLIILSTDFKKIDEWDSLVALSIIAMVDEEFEVLLTGNDMMKCATIDDLYLRISSLLS